MSEPPDQTGPEDGAENAATVGARLRAAREARGAELNAVSQALRMEITMIQALEADDFSAFSAPVFAKGYLKRYADYLGLDADEALSSYSEQVGDQQEPVVSVSTPIKLRDERQIALWIVAAALLGVVALAALFWWRSGTEPVTEPVFEAELLPETTPTVADAVDEPPPDDATPEPPPQETSPATDPAPAAAAVPAESDPVLGPGDLRIELTFSEDCWAEVTDADGARLFYGLGRAGARSVFTAVAPVSFLLGNVNGVALTVNGSDYAVPRESRQGNLARFVVLEPGA